MKALMYPKIIYGLSTVQYFPGIEFMGNVTRLAIALPECTAELVPLCRKRYGQEEGD